MFELPFETSLVIYLAFASLILSFLTLVAMILKKLKRTIQRGRGRLVKRPGVTRTLFTYLSIFLWMALSAAFLFLAAFIQSYQSFTREKLVAEIRCVPLEGDVSSVHLELVRFENGQRQPPQEFILNGDQWALEGDILKWDSWLNFVGLHTMYKLTRVRGRFVNYRDEISQKATAYSLIENEEDPRWAWLFRYGHKLRFVSAVYGNTVYTFPSTENAYAVYVGTSGFIARVRGELESRK